MAMAVIVILVLGPILAAAQREQLCTDTDVQMNMMEKNIMMKVIQEVKIQYTVGRQISVFVIGICWEFATW